MCIRDRAPFNPFARSLSGRGGASAGGRPRPRLGSARAAARASFHACRRTSSRASVAHFTTWNGSATPHRVGAGLGDDRVDKVSPISRNMGDLRTPVLTEKVEELPHRGAGAPRCGPHQPPCVVVHDHHQILVALLVADLIDPDPAQSLETVTVSVDIGPHPGDCLL